MVKLDLDVVVDAATDDEPASIRAPCDAAIAVGDGQRLHPSAAMPVDRVAEDVLDGLRRDDLVLIIGGVAWWLAGLASRRLRREAGALAAQAEAVAGGHLDARVEVSDDELTRVATSLNAMTERLATADQRQLHREPPQGCSQRAERKPRAEPEGWRQRRLAHPLRGEIGPRPAGEVVLVQSVSLVIGTSGTLTVLRHQFGTSQAGLTGLPIWLATNFGLLMLAVLLIAAGRAVSAD